MYVNIFERAGRFVNRYFSFMFNWMNLEWDSKLEEAIKFTGLKLNPKEVTVFAWFAAFFSIFLSLCIAAIFYYWKIGNPFIVTLLGFMIACVLALYISNYPKRLEKIQKIKALGSAPELVAYMIIPLKHNPNLEEAVRFAAEHSDGPMAEDMKKALYDVWSGEYRSIGEALPILGHRWGRDVKGFEDAMYAIRTSQIEKSESRRLSSLDRALESILQSMKNKFEEFINYLRIPTLILFAGGALFPLVVIVMLPLISFIGIDVATPLNLFTCLIFIVLAVFLFSEYTLGKRPLAFKTIEIPRDHPDISDTKRIRIFGKKASIAKISIGIAVLISLFSLPYFIGYSLPVTDFLTTLPIVVGISLGLWFYFRYTALPMKGIRDILRNAEEQMIETSFQIGNRLMTGMSAEDSFIKVSRMLREGETTINKEKSLVSEILESAVRNIRYLNMNLEDSLFDKEKGALRNIHSRMIISTFEIFTTTMKRGIKSASEALITAANHMREIRKVEEDMRRKISYTTSMIRMTVLIINPAVCALAVYISETFSEIIRTTESGAYGPAFTEYLLSRGSTVTPEILQLITGIYMILLLIVLTRYVVLLEEGNDPISSKLEIARGIPIALAVFTSILMIGRVFL